MFIHITHMYTDRNSDSLRGSVHLQQHDTYTCSVSKQQLVDENGCVYFDV